MRMITEKELYEHAEYALLLENSFYEFALEAWEFVEPTPYDPTSSFKIICDHLQYIYEGKCNRFIENIPPGFCKSLLTSVLFPAWVWTKHPSVRFLTGSYAVDLALRDTIKSRDLINSDWYQYFWGQDNKLIDNPELASKVQREMFALSKDQNQKSYYSNNRKGYRQAFGTSGKITGLRGDIIILDDPLNLEKSYSKNERDKINRIASSLISRLNDPLIGIYILVMQRLHVNDPTGYLLSKKTCKWEHLFLPLEYKDNLPRCKTSIFTDNRKDGEILWDKYTPEIIAERKEFYGSLQYNAQCLQHPQNEEGTIFDRSYIKYYKELPALKFIIQSWDTAFKKTKTSDYSTCTTWGTTENAYYLIDKWTDKVELPELISQSKLLAAKFKPHQIIIEDKASGQDLIPMLKKESCLPIKGISVDVSKELRAHQVTPLFEASKVLFPTNKPWISDFVDALCEFPNIPHDDEIDSLTLALNFLHLKYKRPFIAII